MISRHRHIWKISARETLPSAWDKLNEGGTHVTKMRQRGDTDLFVAPVLITYECVACGSQKVERV